MLLLATDTTPSSPGAASPPGSAGGAELAPGTHVRRRVVELMEVVLRWEWRGKEGVCSAVGWGWEWRGSDCVWCCWVEVGCQVGGGVD